MQNYLYTKFGLVFCFVCLYPVSVKAQITPDSTLGNTPSIVVPDQVINGVPSDLITGGATRESTLFHSFREFNVNTGRGAYFNNSDGITNILTRVTGSNPSNILGKLGVLGQANLFFLNPNGIFFGPNAQIDLKGAFLATTATDFNFPGGSSFSAVNPQNAPLLTVNVPIGLGFAGNPGSIEVQGVGHTLSTSSVLPDFLDGAGASTTGLRVQSGKDIALVGGNIIFNGGVVTAPAGRIEIGSVDVGQITINPLSGGWIFDYSSVQNFQDIQITNLSLLDASGLGSGAISLQGNQIALSNGSYALIQSQEATTRGNISVNALQSLSLIGNIFNVEANNYLQAAKSRTGIVSQGVLGQGANINISTKDLLLQSAGVVVSYSFLSGSGGDLLINAIDSIQILGASPVNPLTNFSVLSTNSYGSSRSGNIAISTTKFSIQDGGSILAATFGSGTGGNIVINAFDSIIVKGSRAVSPVASVPSAMASSSYAVGNSGDLFINTAQLSVLDGASVSTSTVASGKAGNLTINASDFVEASGFVQARGLGSQTIFPSLITSSGLTLDPLLQELLGLPSIPSGESGNVTVKTRELILDNTAQVTVRNDGTGDAGALIINANFINLDNRGGITATTASGQGGNIILQAENLQLRHNSPITASAGGIGNGGNITINTDTLAALEDSDITANAFEGRGGNIQINTQGIFRSPDSDITASSRFGLNGVVEIRTLGFNTTNVLTPFADNFVTTEQVVANSCLARRNAERGSFVVTGSGGLPLNPYSGMSEWELLTKPVANVPESPERSQRQPTSNQVATNRLPVAQVDAQRSQHNPTSNQETAAVQPSEPQSDSNEIVIVRPEKKWNPGDPIVEAQKLVVTADGRTLAIADRQATPESPESLVCHSSQNR